MTTTYHITDIRNIALAGHGASGKTSLADAMLYASGVTGRLGSVDDGTSLSDSEDEEKRRHFTIDCHPLHCEWSGKQVHLLDTPGYPDFIGHALSALAAVENVVLTVAGNSGVEVNTRRIVQEATRLHLGGLIALTKMDAEGVDFLRVMAEIRESFGTRCVPFFVPIGQGASFSGVVDVIAHHDDVPPGCPMHPAEAYRMVVEQIVETDEVLMERYLEGETIPPDTLREAAHLAILAGQLVPIACVSAKKDVGVREMLDLLAEITLKPDEVHRFGPQGRGGRRDRTRARGRRGAGRAGLQDDERPVRGQAQRLANPFGADHSRHDAGEPPDRQDEQAGAPLPAPGEGAGGGQGGDRRRHHRRAQVRRPAHLRHRDRRRQRPHPPPLAQPDPVPDADGPQGRRAQDPRGRAQDLRRPGQARRRGPDPSPTAATPRPTSW